MAVHSAQGPVNSILSTGVILTGRTGASIGYIINNLGGGRRFLTFDLASLVMYCIDAPQRIVTKSLHVHAGLLYQWM
jgi:hypothetical protein